MNYAARQDAAEQLVVDIVGAGGKAITVKADMSHPADVEALFKTASQTMGESTSW